MDVAPDVGRSRHTSSVRVCSSRARDRVASRVNVSLLLHSATTCDAFGYTYAPCLRAAVVPLFVYVRWRDTRRFVFRGCARCNMTVECDTTNTRPASAVSVVVHPFILYFCVCVSMSRTRSGLPQETKLWGHTKRPGPRAARDGRAWWLVRRAAREITFSR